jgi:DNA-binding NarL/FixJ family response regulator
VNPSQSQTNTDLPLIRVLIVDDVEQVRSDLRFLLQVSGEVQVVGEAGDGRQALQQAQLLHPDVVLMDLEMPVLNGLQATSEIKQQGLANRVVILSVHTDPEDITLAMQAGADCFVQKGSSYATLMQAINPKNQQKEE